MIIIIMIIIIICIIVFVCLQMVVTNMEYYLNLLVSKTPLFTVETILSAPEIVLHPHANELCKIMMVAMREVVDR